MIEPSGSHVLSADEYDRLIANNPNNLAVVRAARAAEQEADARVAEIAERAYRDLPPEASSWQRKKAFTRALAEARQASRSGAAVRARRRERQSQATAEAA